MRFAEGHPGHELQKSVRLTFGSELEHRSDRANEVAQNTVKNPWLAAEAEQGGGTTTGPATGGSAIQKQQPGKAEHKLYFYHPDHLGSTGYVTDETGSVYQHLQYFPFGETWTEEASNTDRIPYLFTGKELDEETGLYYFGARYYDPRASLWVSTDAYLEKYLPTEEQQRNAVKNSTQDPIGKMLPSGFHWQPNSSLPADGGAYNSINLNLYSYVGNKPLNYMDPDGNAGERFQLYMIEQGTKNGQSFGAIAILTKGDQYRIIPANTFPNQNMDAGILKAGSYQGTFSNTAHKNRPGIRLTQSYQPGGVPTEFPNAAQGGEMFATAVNIHDAGGVNTRGSENCPTFPSNYANDFWGILQEGDEGIIHIIRANGDSNFNAKELPFFQNGGFLGN